MGLGGAAEGALVVQAMMVFGTLALVVVILAVVLRWRTHRWRSSVVLVSGVAGLTLVIVAANYFSPEARDLRRTTAFSREVSVALDLGEGVSDLAQPPEKRDCLRGNSNGWVVSAGADPFGNVSSVPEQDLTALADKVEAGLSRMGMSTDRGQIPDGRFTDWWISGHRGSESVFVKVGHFGHVVVRTEVSECLDLGDLGGPVDRR